MGRWMVPLVLVAAVGMPHVGANAPTELASEERTFSAPVPCSVACPYWTDLLGHQGACQPEPVAPPGSWDDYRFVVPDEIDGRVPELLTIDVEIEMDYDNFLCLVTNPGPDEEWEEVATFANLLQPCDNSIGPVPLGCDESAAIPVEPGMVLVMRAYNWSDLADEHALFRWWVL